MEVFAGYDVAVDDDAYCRTFAGDEDFAKWIEKRQLKSDFQSGIEIRTDDSIIILFYVLVSVGKREICSSWKEGQVMLKKNGAVIRRLLT